MRRALLVVVSLLAVVMVAGCGGDDEGGGKASAKQVYAQQLAGATGALQEAFADIDQVGANVSSKQIIKHRETQAAVIEDAVKKLRRVNPPAELTGAHRKLIEGLQELAASFRSGDGKDAKPLAEALQSLPTSTGVKKLTEASAEFKAKGVTVTTASE
jgi:hypothetical protein